MDVCNVNSAASTPFTARLSPSWVYWANYYKHANLGGGNISIDFTFGQTGTFYTAAALFKDVDQTSPFSGLQSNSSSANDVPTTLAAVTSSDATDLIVDLMSSGSAADPLVTDSGATRYDFSPTASVPRFAIGQRAGGSNKTPIWDIDDGFHGWAIWAIALKAAAVGSSIAPLAAIYYAQQRKL
jgi:hypothetical protein